MKPAAALPPLALLVAGAIAGCSSDTTATTELPACSAGADGTASNGVVLMAQSVPTATWVPCMRTTLPIGWDFHHLDARNDVSRFWLDSDRDGMQAIGVRLTGECDTDGASEIPSDRNGLRRLERVSQTTPTYLGERYYLFEGGCITFSFRLAGENRGEPLALATHAVGLISRDELRAQVHDESGGRLSLDPVPDEDG